MLTRLTSVTFQSQYEVLALCYSSDRWHLNYSTSGSFEPGRPFLLAQFLSTGAGKPMWVAAVHLNHYFLTPPGKPRSVDTVIPGAVLESAFASATAATGADIAQESVIMFGDWNEFEWADFPQPYKADAQHRMAPLWDGYFGGRMADAVVPHTVSCCTKWAAKDRATRSEWTFEYDHIFYSSDLVATVSSNAPPFLPYTYPGLSVACGDASCTGQDPPGNATATAQGSWHRAVHVTFGR